MTRRRHAVARRLVGLVLPVALLVASATAFATPPFGRHDVRTVFQIGKSDDRNRVDYGIRLDSGCRPVGGSPIYAYWHRFEPGQPRFGELNMLDQRVYGIASQAVRTRHPNGSWTEMHVAALPDLRILILAQATARGCLARAQIPVNSRPAYVDRVFVQLSSPFSIDHVTFYGIDVQTSERVSQRRQGPR